MSQLDINYNSRPTSFSSFRHKSLDNDDTDRKGLSAITSPKRYATYELNWSNPSYSDHIDRIDRLQNNDTSTNSAQVASRWSLPEPSPPPTTPLPPIPQEQLQYQQQQQYNNNNNNNNNNSNNNKSSPRHSRKSISPINTRRSELRDKNEDEPQSPFGGITVTTVKVVEILHSPTEKEGKDDYFKGKSQQKNSRPEPLNLTSADPVGIITSERSKDRKQRVNLSPPPPPPVSRPPPPLPQNHNHFNGKKNQDPKMLKQKKRSSIINSQKFMGNKNVKKPEMIIPKEMAFIDPRLLAHNKSLFRTPSMTTTTAAATTSVTKNRNRKTLKRGGGSFYKKRAPPKNLEFGSTSNPVHSNDPTDMEADLPPIKQQMFPWLPGSSKPPQLLHASLVPLPHRTNRGTNRDSHIITNNMIENVSVNPKRNSKIISGRLSRVNSKRRRTSIIAPDPNRASLVFRRQILEESLMMSFSGMMMNGVQQQQPTSVTKPSIRRKTKKVSNAKIEDRETRRERRRKEKSDKKFAQNNNNNNIINQIEGTNTENENNVIMKSKIFEVENQKKELYMGPQPPPRKQSQDKTITPPPQKPKNNALSLLPSPTDRKLGNSNGSSSLESSADDPPPFPTHLARSTLFFEHTSNKEKSKRKQPTYSPSIGQPASSPISPISNYSRITTSTSEGNENNEESQYDIISSEETSSIHQLPSPTLSPNKSQKIGMGILGLFNKQTAKDPTTPPLSQISSPTFYPTQLPPQSSSTTPLSTTPPESPPLSPRTLKVSQQLLGKSRRGSENGSASPPAVQDQEKKRKIERKMEKFEALIAGSEVSSNKKPITEKIKAITSAITTAASTATSSASSSIMTSNTSLEKRKKSADGTPSHSPRYSSEGSFKSVGKESEQKNGLSRDSSSSRGSLTNSLTDSIRYKSDERSELGPGDDGVIRVTITPAVCR